MYLLIKITKLILYLNIYMTVHAYTTHNKRKQMKSVVLWN